MTEANKLEYVQLVCQMRMTGAIRKQLGAFLEGFYDIIPKHLISIFNEQELELLLCGLPTIDIDDLKANTEYHKYQITSLQVCISVVIPVFSPICKNQLRLNWWINVPRTKSVKTNEFSNLLCLRLLIIAFFSAVDSVVLASFALI